jgi:RNA polymerase sigma factor (sigma-70 family)
MSDAGEVRDFTRCWERDGPRLTAYARRHVAPDEVHDVVAETFLVAWRRWDDVTDPPIAWLLATARKVVGNQRRARDRRRALHDRLALLGSAAASADDAGLVADDRSAALGALAALPEQQREALLLLAWDGLTPDQAAAVLGVRPGTFRVRVHRARLAIEALDRAAVDHGAPARTPTPSRGATP